MPCIPSAVSLYLLFSCSSAPVSSSERHRLLPAKPLNAPPPAMNAWHHPLPLGLHPVDILIGSSSIIIIIKLCAISLFVPYQVPKDLKSKTMYSETR